MRTFHVSSFAHVFAGCCHWKEVFRALVSSIEYMSDIVLIYCFDNLRLSFLPLRNRSPCTRILSGHYVEVVLNQQSSKRSKHVFVI